MTPQSQKHAQDPMSCDDNDADERQLQQHHTEDNNIDRLVAQRTLYRREKKWKEADEIKAVLEDQQSGGDCTIELIDRCDGSSSWRRKIVHHEKNNAQHTSVKIVQWSRMNVTWPSSSSPTNNSNETDSSHHAVDVPLVLVTVDSPHYRERLGETLQHLKEICSRSDDDDNDNDNKACRFCPEPVDMLDLAKHPLLNSKRILFEGWRTVLLPHLLRPGVEYSRNGFVLVAEDDVRFPPKWTPDRIRTECMAALQSNPDVHILSMGHNWAALRPNRQRQRRQKRRSCSSGSNQQEIIIPNEPRPSLLQHLQKNGGIHASTLFAIRAPEGLQYLLDALNAVKRNKKKTHIDQFLFLSTLHNVGLALSDPPLVGWAEVSTTLTSAGPGQRRRDGGRLGQLPAQNDNRSVEWVQRKLVTMKVHHVNKLEHDNH